MTTSIKCRVCICSLDADAVFYDMRKLPKLAHKFVTCTDLSVSDDKRVPSELCRLCHDQLERLYAFRARSIAADTKWRMEILAFCDDNCSAEVAEVVPCQDMEYGKTHADEPMKDVEQSAGPDEVEDMQNTANMEAESEEKMKTPLQLNSELDSDQSLSQQQKTIYKCEICGAQFLDQHRLKVHKRQHGTMPHPCPEPGCDRGYSHKNTLSLHMRKVHNIGKEFKSYVCEFCGKKFDALRSCKNHRNAHKDKSELPYVCEEPNCERCFSSKQLLKMHMRCHAGIKNYKCTFCGVQKTTRTELKIHLNYHTLERAYCCRICSKVCNSSSHLSMHMRTIHEQSENYACSYCDRRFNLSFDRKKHELTHTGKKPHECEDCGRYFREKEALYNHRKIHERQPKETNSTPTTRLSASMRELLE